MTTCPKCGADDTPQPVLPGQNPNWKTVNIHTVSIFDEAGHRIEHTCCICQHAWEEGNKE